MIRIRAPAGFRFEITPARLQKSWQAGWSCNFVVNVSLVDSKTGNLMGFVDLKSIDKSKRNELHDPLKHQRFETHSSLDESLLGKGIGILIYRKAIFVGHSRGLKICSSKISSDDAKRLWRSKRLRKFHKILRKNKRWHVIK